MMKNWMYTMALVCLTALAACGPDNAAQGVGDGNNDSNMTTPVAMDMGAGDMASDLDEIGEDADLRVMLDMGAEEDMAPVVDMAVDMSEPVDMAPPGPTLYVGEAPIYSNGPLGVTMAQLPQGSPVPGQVWSPTQPGLYAVVVLQHGFLLSNTYYSQLIAQIASHGFIVVAPQMYEAGGLPFGKPSTEEEITLATQTWAFIRENLSTTLPTGVEASAENFGVVGHSRGAKVAWGVLLKDATLATALVGIDPVDNPGGFAAQDPVITGPTPFAIPTLVIGTGLGPDSVDGFSPACAPEGENYAKFYDAAQTPAYRLVATEHGHLDMLDDTLSGCGLECSACPGGGSKQAMRSATAGWIVALMRGALQGDATAFALIAPPSGAPTTVTAESK